MFPSSQTYCHNIRSVISLIPSSVRISDEKAEGTGIMSLSDSPIPAPSIPRPETPCVHKTPTKLTKSRIVSSAPRVDFYMDDVEKMARDFFGYGRGVDLIGSSVSNREAVIMKGARKHLKNFNPMACVIAENFISRSVNPIGMEKTPEFREHGDA
jgi:hypothetical protein